MFGLGRRKGIDAIRDPNLRLAVLNATWSAGLLKAFDVEAFYRDVIGEPFDAERHGHEPDERVRAALLAVPLGAAVLERLGELTWEGGQPLQHMVFSFWSGEDDCFEVIDLAGIADACPNLASLKLGDARIDDIAPLRGMRKLARFELRHGAGDVLVHDLEPLLSLPALAHLRIGPGYRDTKANNAVLLELQKRGVNAPTIADLRANSVERQREWERKNALDRGLEAWNEKRYAMVVEVLGPHESELDGSLLKKLAFARKQSGMQG